MVSRVRAVPMKWRRTMRPPATAAIPPCAATVPAAVTSAMSLCALTARATARLARPATAAAVCPAVLTVTHAAVATASMRVAVLPVMTPTWIPNMPNHKTHPLTRRHLRRPRRKRRAPRPVLTFSPTAWAKLLFLRDLGPTEVGGFGITEPDDLLCVRDIVLVEQQCTETFVSFDDLEPIRKPSQPVSRYLNGAWLEAGARWRSMRPIEAI